MPEVFENYPLKNYNTFGLNVLADFFVEVHSVEDLRALLAEEKYRKMPKLFLGGGSNILFTKNFNGLVIKNSIKGIEKIKEDDAHVWLKIGSGEVWHELVLFAIENNLGGIENLSLIPGTVGAAPIQNIGAYGVELKEVFESLDAIDLQNFNQISIDALSCNFGYRDSIFKHEAKGKYFITYVILKLSKKHSYNVSYGAIQQVLKDKGIEEFSIAEISKAVCEIRTSKLPDPKKLGNAGSFFKNPEIPENQYRRLKEVYENMPSYPTSEGFVKVPAGWLIEQCGWRGKRVGNTGSHKDQSLVLVNYGDAKGEEIAKLSIDIQQSVKEKFGIILETEVNII